ncbi:acyl-CoA dehydrogenase family protein [Brucella intermedia GD04153]|uniref:Acyl-CoA dehydrogenase family protein n=1 Tax=Brucella intermedia GD04153 TaxID=2975438 RepID=A0AA42H731_9HYPH|nr:acyl-CoA dehydrogenase family protein [Brucella intermedia]MDH0126763.1 acyl-CoA dehydrogenase family protein [Brucella intermedia GD04153]
MTDLISESAKRLFAHYPAAPDDMDGLWNSALWRAIVEAGFPLALLSEEEGGFSLEAEDAFSLLRIAAANCATVPLGETMLANWMLAQTGLPLSEGPAAIILSDGEMAVPFGRHLQTLVTVAGQEDGVIVSRYDLRVTATDWQHGANLAGEPRDHLKALEGAGSQQAGRATLSADTIDALGALVRVQQIAGALQAVLDMTVRYAGERVQFGKPIAKFQAIQQYLAVMAGEVAAANAAASMAAQAFPFAVRDAQTFVLIVAAAKIRAGEAVGSVASLSHQVHGAIGFSREYALHLLTRRLWSWRDEYGREADWAGKLGNVAFKQPTGLWPFVTKLQSDFF